MFKTVENSLDLFVKYGETGKKMFDVITKYDNLELKNNEEQENLLQDLKYLIDNNSIEFNDKILLINSILNNCQVIKELF